MSWIKRFFGLGDLEDVVRYVNKQLDGTADYSATSNKSKLEIIFSNPAVLKVISLQCELFSLGKIYAYKDGVNLEKDVFIDMLKMPNYFQTESQMKWDFMFWQMLGNSYQYIESRNVSDDNNLYFLDSSKLEMNIEIDKYKDKIILSKSTKKSIDNTLVKYTYSDGTSTNLKWGNIIHIPDLTNGSGNWFAGQSRIDALHKIICNSEAALDAKNINLRFSGKYMVAGQSDPKDTFQTPLTSVEQQDIESKMNGRKSVHAVKSMIDIKRFVENIANLQLDESYLACYYNIGMAYNIPKDVLEAYVSGTFENQEKARGAHVSYCLQPKGDAWMESLVNFFSYDKELIMDWEHLPFMQVFAKDRAETHKIQSETVINYVKLGLPIEEINTLLDMELTALDYESAKLINNSNNVK